jgi:hypothetical protein
MCRWILPFRDFSGALGFKPRVPSRWTVLIVSRFRDLRLQSFYQLETPVINMPAVSSMSTTCPNKWTTVILSLFHVSRFHEFRTLVVTIFQNRELRYADLTELGSSATCPLRWTTHKSSRDFAISCIGVLECNHLCSSKSRFPILRWDKIDGSRSFLIQRSRMTRDFAIREFSQKSSDLYTLRVSEMPRSRHVFLDGWSR